jgi:hypothetical protein
MAAFGRMLLLRLFDPAGAYMERQGPAVQGPVWRGGAIYGPAPDGSRPASDAELPDIRERASALANDRRERVADIRARYGAAIDATAQTLARTGVGVVATPAGGLDARIIRFWHGDSVLVIERHSGTGRLTTRLAGRQEHDIDVLAWYLARSLA